jgi:hypothetical protein
VSDALYGQATAPYDEPLIEHDQLRVSEQVVRVIRRGQLRLPTQRRITDVTCWLFWLLDCIVSIHTCCNLHTLASANPCLFSRCSWMLFTLQRDWTAGN